MPLAKTNSRTNPKSRDEVMQKKNGCRKKVRMGVNKSIYGIAILLILVLTADIIYLLNYSFLLS